MSEFGRRFDPSELANGEPGGNDDAAAAELLVIARDLEAFARSESVTPSIDFEDRVMAAIAVEPPPRPITSHGVAGLVALVRDSWRLAWTGNRPMAVRAQAMAFVLLAAVALGSVVSLGAVGVGRLLSQAEPPPTVAPAPVPTPTRSPTPSMSPSPSVSPTPSPSPSASPSQETAEPTETIEPTETAGSTNDSSGPGSGSGSDSSGPGSGGTARPTDDSSGPGSGSGDDSSGSGSGSGG
jgi:uncharacterized membrane protein YgcG